MKYAPAIVFRCLYRFGTTAESPYNGHGKDFIPEGIAIDRQRALTYQQHQ